MEHWTVRCYLFPREALRRLSIVVVESGSLLVSHCLQSGQLPVATFEVAQLTVEYQ